MNIPYQRKKRLAIRLSILTLVVIPSIFIFIQLFTIRKPIMDFSKAIMDPAIYDNALEIAKREPKVVELLGDIKPIDVFRVLEGDVLYTDNNTTIKITVGLQGSKKRGKLDIKAKKVNKKWEYKFIRVRTKKPKKAVVVLSQP